MATVQRSGDVGTRAVTQELRRGHRLVPHTADCIVESWGPNLPVCLIEALASLVGSFAEVPDAATSRVLPLATSAGGAEDALVALLEEVIYVLDVFSMVPMRFHLEETEEGGLAGDMEVVPAAEVRLTGSVPKGVPYHDLSIGPVDGGWRCHVLVDV